MIVRREWYERSAGGLIKDHCVGWFLFGFIPLYIRKDCYTRL